MIQDWITTIHVKECEQQEDSDNDKYSGELAPIISRDAFENEATKFLEKYYPFHFNDTDSYQIEEMISELADFYGLSKQAVKMRIREMGYAKVDDAFTYVNGQCLRYKPLGSSSFD